MSSSYIFQNTRKKKKNPDKIESIINKVLWITIISLLIIAFVKLFFEFVISPNVLIKNIEIESELSLNKDQILSLAGIGKKEYYFNLNSENIVSRLKKNLNIREVHVEKIFPDTLRLEIYKRTPIAIALIEENGRSIPLSFDDEGIVFEIDDSVTDWNLPIISGLTINNYKLGMKLPESLDAFVEELKKIMISFRELYNLISEIKIVPIQGANFELLLYFIHYRTPVRVSSRINDNILKYAMMVLDVLQKQEMTQRIREIDFRTKEVVYRFQGGDA